VPPATRSRTRRRLALAAFLAAGALPVMLGAQGKPSLAIDLPPDSLLTRRGPTVRAMNMLASEHLRDLIEHGFPARFHTRVELVSQGRFFFDQLEASAEWDVFVRYLPTEKKYDVVQVVNDRPLSLGKFTAVADAERAVGRTTGVGIVAPKSDRPHYYQVTMLVEALSERDIDDVARWLRGDVEPGLTGDANPGSVLARGVRTFASKLLGGEKSEYEAHTPHFRVP
jgi:hypothetical protein